MKNWHPSATLNHLQKRAQIIARIRSFFSDRHVLEVETPLLGDSTVTDPFIQSIQTVEQQYLQTSPEYAMKRLIAAGYGDLFQICKAFRQEESGRIHHTEFTMLEWYRMNFDHHALMDDMDDLLQFILNREKAKRSSYQQLFEQHFSINPHTISVHDLENIAEKYHLNQIEGMDNKNKDVWLQLLMSEIIEPTLKGVHFVYDYPASQAALAKIKEGVAERFEVYIDGVELANGFHELQDAKEQRKRFEHDLKKRKKEGFPYPPIDEKFIAEGCQFFMLNNIFSLV